MTKRERERKHPPLVFFYSSSFSFPLFFSLLSEGNTHTHTQNNNTSFFFFLSFLIFFLIFYYRDVRVRVCYRSNWSYSPCQRCKTTFSFFIFFVFFLFLFRLCSAVWFFSSRGNLLILLSCGHFIYYQFSFLSFLSLSLPFFFLLKKK